MSWKKDKSTVALVVLSLGLVFTLLLRQTGRMDVVQDWVNGVIVPVQYTFARLFNSASGRFHTLTQIRQLEAQKRELEETVSQLMLRTIELEEARIELELLREQLGFKKANPQYQTLSAEVIGHDPTNLVRFLMIDRGAGDGIKRGMPVISSRGLVGRIVDTSVHSSKVLLLTDSSSSVNAMIQRSRATGIVQGRIGHNLTMRNISPGESVLIDDIVMTSGLGGNFPKHLVIGQVISVHQNDVEMFQEAEIRSAVDFGRLETVMVILDFPSTDSDLPGG